MSRVALIDPRAPPDREALLALIHQTFGVVPNMFRCVANPVPRTSLHFERKALATKPLLESWRMWL